MTKLGSMDIKRSIEIGKNGSIRIGNPVGDGRIFPVSFSMEWDIICRHRRRLVDGLKCNANKNKKFLVTKSAAISGVEMSILVSKWDTRHSQTRAYSGTGRLSSLASPSPLILVEELAKKIVENLYHFWRVRITLGRKQLLSSDWKLVDSFEITSGPEEWSISWDELSAMMENHFKI